MFRISQSHVQADLAADANLLNGNFATETQEQRSVRPSSRRTPLNCNWIFQKTFQPGRPPRRSSSMHPPTSAFRLRLVGPHLRGDRFLRGGRKFTATNAGGPLGDRTLPPPHHGAVSCAKHNLRARTKEPKFIAQVTVQQVLMNVS